MRNLKRLAFLYAAGVCLSACLSVVLVEDKLCSIEGLREDCYPGVNLPEGECKVGTRTCRGGVWSDCEGYILPTIEICDDRDNDCTGAKDEGCECTATVKKPCGTSLGECEKGVQPCVDGKLGACEGAVGPSEEVCDGKDNDCDGNTDEGCECSPGETEPCYAGPEGTSGIGECREGTLECIEGTLSNFCDGEVLPTDEICDGKDNDCDGDIDEEVDCQTGLPGKCKLGKTRCVDTDGDPPECVPVNSGTDIEKCDGEDNDCDGVIDNDAECAMDGTFCVNGQCQPKPAPKP